MWLRNLNKSRAASVVKETTTTFILMLEITNNHGLASATSLTPPSVITVGEWRGLPSLKAPKLRIRTIPLYRFYRIYIIQNIHYTEYPLHRTLFLTSKNSPLDIQFPSLYSILFGLSSVDREWQVYYIQSCYRSLQLTHSSESQEIVEGEARVAL